MVVLRRQLGGIEMPRLLDGAVRIALASALLAGVSYLVWDSLDGALGDGTLAQIGSRWDRAACWSARSSTSARCWRCGSRRRGSSCAVDPPLRR